MNDNTEEKEGDQLERKKSKKSSRKSREKKTTASNAQTITKREPPSFRKTKRNTQTLDNGETRNTPGTSTRERQEQGERHTQKESTTSSSSSLEAKQTQKTAPTRNESGSKPSSSRSTKSSADREELSARKMATMSESKSNDKEVRKAMNEPMAPGIKSKDKEARYARKMAAINESTSSTNRDDKEARYTRKMAAMNEPSTSTIKSNSDDKETRYARKMAAMNDSASSNKSKSDDKEARYARKMAAMNEPSSASTTKSKSDDKEARYARKMAEMNEPTSASTSTSQSEKEAKLARKMAAMNESTSSTLEPKSDGSKEARNARKMAAMNESSGISNNKKKKKSKRSTTMDSSSQSTSSSMNESMQNSGLSQESLATRSRIRDKEAKRSAKQREASGGRATTTILPDSLSSIQESSKSSLNEPSLAGSSFSSRNSNQTGADYSEEFVASTGAQETRLATAATTSKSRGRSGNSNDEGDDDFEPGAYSVETRAIGALPAWARNDRPAPPQQEDSDDDYDYDDLPPEMRRPRDPSDVESRGTSQAVAPPELQEQVPMYGDNDFITTAEVSYGDASPYYQEPKVTKFYKSRKFWIVTGASVLVAIGIAVGVGVGLSSSSGGSGGESNPCDFGGMEQPDVFLQCECNGEITMLSDSASTRYQELLDTIMPQVNPGFNEPSSSCTPENAALAWLSTDEYATLTTDVVTLTNRYVLALLFQTWRGTDWTQNTGWLSATSECSWYGISCDGTAVVGMELGSNRLQSSTADNGLPVELFALTSLRAFNVSSAALRGNIPSDIRSLVNLETFDVGSFQSFLVQYPNELFSLPSLRVMNVAYPTGGSTIPTYVGLMTRLETIIASKSGLVGSLPTELGLVTSLQNMVLFSNGLAGILATEIGLLQNLKFVDLSQNRLEQAIPSELGALSQLLYLDLGLNALRGPIPTEVAGLPSLEYLRLKENRLTGTVPSEMLNAGKLLCFNAISTLMDNFIPQGQFVEGAKTIGVACEEDDDPAYRAVNVGPMDLLTIASYCCHHNAARWFRLALMPRR